MSLDYFELRIYITLLYTPDYQTINTISFLFLKLPPNGINPPYGYCYFNLFFLSWHKKNQKSQDFLNFSAKSVNDFSRDWLPPACAYCCNRLLEPLLKSFTDLPLLTVFNAENFKRSPATFISWTYYIKIALPRKNDVIISFLFFLTTGNWF